MCNDAYIDDSYMQQQQDLEQQEFELYEFNELNKLGVKNEHRRNDIRAIRNGQINKPTQYESSRNFAYSNDTEATPF
jgi:hypothetical protein